MLTLFSPAKINLFLRIISKRPDGFHNLSSLFQTISLGDTLTFELDNQDKLTCSTSEIPSDHSNLILKATHLFRCKSGFDCHFKVNLIKRIPSQAGLGGGSSNAATTLWACNQLTDAQFSISTLAQWGAEIGSDVPFFFSQGTAYCTERGEKVYNLPPLASPPLSVVKPPGGLSTPDVYRRLHFGQPISEKSMKQDLDTFFSGTPLYFNDLEKPAFEIRPELAQLKNELKNSGFNVVLLSGSGSAFFCLGEGTPPPNITSFSAKYLNRSPLNWYSEVM